MIRKVNLSRLANARGWLIWYPCGTMRTLLHPLSFLPIALVAAGLASGAGCAESGKPLADAGAADEASLEEDVLAEGPGLTLAQQVSALLTGPEAKCQNCHTVNQGSVQVWGSAMLAVEAACIMKPGLTPQQRVDCLRTNPASSTSPFSTKKLGLYAAGASQPQFAKLFAAAYGPTQGPVEHAAFVQKVRMPLGGPDLTAAQFAKIKGWVLREMPSITEVFDGSINPNPQCSENTTSADLLAHIALMKTQGWGARLADLSTPMFGCNGAANALDCLAAQPDVTATFAAPATSQKVRQLRSQPLASHYWVRSSSDGRYVGFGLNNGARVLDLTNPTKPINIEASYDPYFFPSNDGFAFAGVFGDFGIHACRQSLLADVGGAAFPSITFNEAKCSSVVGDVYQSIGSSLDNLRYFVTVGAHENDDGGHDITSPLPSNFGSNAKTQFFPMENDGLAYQVGNPVTLTLAGEGDAVLSPSSRLMSMRFRRSNGQSAYRVRLVKAQGAGPSLSITAPLGAQVCIPGAKASFSFDERFMVTHQYVDHADPDQAALPLGSSNIMLVDLKTNTKVRLTTMPAGRFALFPHFRADGWLYYLVRDMNANTEFVLATDAALRVAG